MTADGFIARLVAGRSVHCTYVAGGLEGLISAWSHDGRFVLTWEECPAGRQYDESTYSRDERREFASADEVLAFVEQAGHPASAFEP
ncbi:MAG TPA: hypothetical protein VF796_25815 [Humisphaera sp.]